MQRCSLHKEALNALHTSTVLAPLGVPFGVCIAQSRGWAGTSFILSVSFVDTAPVGKQVARHVSSA